MPHPVPKGLMFYENGIQHELQYVQAHAPQQGYQIPQGHCYGENSITKSTLLCIVLNAEVFYYQESYHVIAAIKVSTVSTRHFFWTSDNVL